MTQVQAQQPADAAAPTVGSRRAWLGLAVLLLPVLLVSMDVSVLFLALPTLTTDLGTAGAAVWSGAAPGGHHREGELSFTVTGTPTEFTLDLGGLPAPVQFSWPAQGGPS